MRELLAQAGLAMVDLMGGRGWKKRYECGHGVPMGVKCYARCRLNRVRRVLAVVEAVTRWSARSR